LKEPTRRRRSDDDAPRGGGLPLFPLVLVVILAGLLLGGALAHFFGGTKTVSRASQTAVAALPSPAQTSQPPLASPSATGKAAALASPSAAPPTITPSPRPAAAQTPRRVAARVVTEATSQARQPTNSIATDAPERQTATSLAVATSHPAATPRPAAAVRQAPTTAPAAPSQPVTVAAENPPVSVVRSYLQALQRGDRATATTYLADGLPTETFVNSQAHIVSIASSSLSAHQYQVNADVQTPTGEYFLTFTVQQDSSGLRITDHSYVKTP